MSLSLQYAGEPADGQFISGYTASAGTLEDNVLTMPDTIVIISPHFLGADECLFDEATGVLTLRGNVSVTDVWQYIDDAKTIVVDDDGCVLPVSCACLFENFTNVTSINLANADASNVESMWRMFYGCSSLTSLKLGDINTSNVQNMSEMFYECTAIEELDVSALDTGKVFDMESMFYGCASLQELDVSTFDMSAVRYTNSMFSDCYKIKTITIGEQHTSINSNMSEMFAFCTQLESVDLGGLDTSSVLDMNSMFRGCASLGYVDLSSFDTSYVCSMSSMFEDCSSLEEIVFDDGFSTGYVTDMSEMFSGCIKVSTLDLSGFDTSSVTDMSYMFYECNALTSVDLSSFDLSKISYTADMFRMDGDNALKTIYVGRSWNIGNTESPKMFKGCTNLVGGAGTVYNSERISQAYAKIDGGESDPGYLSKHSLTVNADKGGTVEIEGGADSIFPGDTVKMNTVANTWHTLKSIVVKDADENEIIVKNDRFVMPYNICLTECFKKDTSPFCLEKAFLKQELCGQGLDILIV